MGKALEMVAAIATAPGSAAAMTAVAGNSLTVRNGNGVAKLLAISGNRQADGFLRVTSPELHDSSFGIQVQFEAGLTNTWRLATGQTLHSQDTLSLTAQGSAVAGDIETNQLHIWYQDIPGIDARLMSAEDVERRWEEIYSVQVTLPAVVTGQYGAQVAINSSNDQFKANRDYAVLGVSMSGTVAAEHAVRMVGPDTGNIGVGIPISSYNPQKSADWFLALSHGSGLPTVPIIGSPNKALTFLQSLGNENSVSMACMLHLALLGEGGNARRK